MHRSPPLVFSFLRRGQSRWYIRTCLARKPRVPLVEKLEVSSAVTSFQCRRVKQYASVLPGGAVNVRQMSKEPFA